MEAQGKITIREQSDLGPVIARADHRDGAIEVNKSIFYRLPPMVQEFVLCHEVCHLKYEEWDEARTNQLASQVFLDRADGEEDLAARRKFLSYMEGKDMSNITVEVIMGIVGGAVSLGTTVWGIIKNRNAGWYSWDETTQKANLEVMLKQAFEESRKTSSQSAADLFWEILCQYDNKDSDLDRFLNRSGNSWVKLYITNYEKKYGFGFTEVTPIDWMSFTAVKIGVGVAVGVAVAVLVRYIVKNRKK